MFKKIIYFIILLFVQFKTYALTPNGYRTTTPEGYVLHHDGDMIKLVNRLEFAFINFTLDKSWK